MGPVVTPALVIAAPSSNSGKTLATLALLRALKNRGVRAASCKTGPDYIDPAFHAAATGRPCFNLDPWAMRPGTVARWAAAASRDADILIVEGVMGLFDGAADGTGSTADLAARMGWPVLLVMDVKGQSASVGAVAQGFRNHRDDVDVVGALPNRVGGAAHAAAVSRALKDLAVPGLLTRREELALPDRHLGLVQAAEHPELDAFLERAAAWAADCVDLDAVLALARPGQVEPHDAPPLPPLGQRIAVARDEAFAFAYPHLLEGWRAAGAEIAPFSPLGDEAPDAGADAVYLPGGYPELHAGRLAGNGAFKAGLARAAGRGAAVYGECGGYMVLGAGLVDAKGARHAMAGLLELETSFAERKLHLGYREAEFLRATPFGPPGTAVRGHEFHYATVLREGGPSLARRRDATGLELARAGCAQGSVFGSFVHVVDAG